MLYLGEGDIEKERIKDLIRSSTVVWEQGIRDDIFNIRSVLESINARMEWRKLFSKREDPLRDILDNKMKDFYRVFDDIKKGKVKISVAGNRYSNPFLLFIDEANYVASVADPDNSSLVYGYGLLETWSADPRNYFINNKGYRAFEVLFPASLAYIITLYIGMDLSTARKVQQIFDPEQVMQKNLNEMVTLTKSNAWVGAAEVQRKAAIALRGYINAWFDFMESSSWLEIHHTLRDTKIVEREQSFLDTATTEINETARGVILDDTVRSIFSPEEMERRERERREKQMDWTMLRIALGILYPREKAAIRAIWESKRRKVTWRYLEETFYEEIWDLMRSHLAGEDIEPMIEEKDTKTLGRWHFIFESRKAERPREKVITLEQMNLQELMERKNMLLSSLKWEGKSLPLDATWNDVISVFRKIIIKYHPDRIEITKVDPEEARIVTAEAIKNFRELEIIHDLEPEIFGISVLPEDYMNQNKRS